MRSRLGALLSMLGRVGLVALVVIGPACGATPKIALEVTVPSDVVDQTIWLEIGAYKDASCTSINAMLANGVPEGFSARVAFRRDEGAAPAFGDIDRGSYAFAAVARAEDCTVLATGCVTADVNKVDKVTIPMATNDPPSGACEKGAVCTAARCVPASDNANSSIGSGCSLELLGAGPLAASLGDGTELSAPAVAATPAGFVIAYREIDSSGNNPRITVLPVDTAGGALSPGQRPLKNRCSGTDETDGVGLVMTGTDGQMVLGRSACGAQPALELISFTAKPDVTVNPTFIATQSATSQVLRLSNAHVSAPGAGGNVIVYTEDGASKIAAIKPTGIDLVGAGSFGGATGMTGAWAASSDRVLALLAAGPVTSTPPPPPDDSGMDAAGAGGDGTEDMGGQLSLLMVPPSTTVDQFNFANSTPRAPILFSGVWGAVAALGTRVMVASDGGGTVNSVSYNAFDLDRITASEQGGISVEGDGAVTTADVALFADRAYFAALKKGGVSLHVLSNASTTPRPLRDVIFAKLPRIPAIDIVRETGRVAIAVTSKRVMVAWTTAKVLTGNDATGGYAVFACTD